MRLLNSILVKIKKLIFFFVKYECIVCGCNLKVRNCICFECNKKIEIIDQSCVCEICGRYCLVSRCIFCLQNPPLFTYAKAFCNYNEISSNIIKQFKYYDNNLCKNFIIQKMTKLLKLHFVISEIDIITCVPTSWLKEYFKGRNHASQIASKIAKNVGIEFSFNILKRKFKWKRQALLNKQERAKNVIGVFSVINKEKIADKNVLIIDDTITTGSTINECTKTMLNAGARSVIVLTFAKSIADESMLT